MASIMFIEQGALAVSRYLLPGTDVSYQWRYHLILEDIRPDTTHDRPVALPENNPDAAGGTLFNILLLYPHHKDAQHLSSDPPTFLFSQVTLFIVPFCTSLLPLAPDGRKVYECQTTRFSS